MLKLKDSRQLELYENYFHKKGYNTINCPEYLKKHMNLLIWVYLVNATNLFFTVEKLHSEEQMWKALVQKIDTISLFPVCNSYSHICYNKTYILIYIYIYLVIFQNLKHLWLNLLARFNSSKSFFEVDKTRLKFAKILIKFAVPTKSPENLVVKSFVFKEKNTEWCCFFNRIIFNYQFIEYRHYAAPCTYVLLLGLFFTMYTKYKRAFAFFREDWKF